MMIPKNTSTRLSQEPLGFRAADFRAAYNLTDVFAALAASA